MSEVAISETQKRLEATTVTSENLAEFQAEKLGLADKPPREAIETIEPQDDDSQSEPASEDQQTTEEKRRPKIERRFEAVTKARDEAKQEAMREREARVSLEQRLAEMVDNEFKLAERIAELEERNERLTRENGSTLLALSKAERELAAEKYEHLHSINQRDGLYVQLEAFKAKVLGSKRMEVRLCDISPMRANTPVEVFVVKCSDVEECSHERILHCTPPICAKCSKVMNAPCADVEPEVQAQGDPVKDFVESQRPLDPKIVDLVSKNFKKLLAD